MLAGKFLRNCWWGMDATQKRFHQKTAPSNFFPFLSFFIIFDTKISLLLFLKDMKELCFFNAQGKILVSEMWKGRVRE